jgi:hypothetical protein
MLTREVRDPGAHAELLDYLHVSRRTSRLNERLSLVNTTSVSESSVISTAPRFHRVSNQVAHPHPGCFANASDSAQLRHPDQANANRIGSVGFGVRNGRS